MNTLKGVFGETKPKYKRNFIQENMRQLREMQGYWRNKEKQINLTVAKPMNKYQNVPSRVGSRASGSQSSNTEPPPPPKSKTGISKPVSKPLSSNNSNPVSHVTQVGITQKSKSPSQRSGGKIRGISESNVLPMDENTLTADSLSISGGKTSRSLGCQTIDPKNINDFYDGVIKYPSTRKVPIPKGKLPLKKPPTREMGLQTERSPSPVVRIAAAGDTPTPDDNNELDLQKLSLSQHNSDMDEPSEVPQVNRVKNTRDMLKSKSPARTTLRARPTHQRGVVPKYLQERKEEWEKEAQQQIRDEPDPACPPGHVTLPDYEREETLKKLRKSYADLVQELNMLPVRTDTLRVKHRKMNIEKQLDKIEKGIKIFSRPKVFVKIGS